MRITTLCLLALTLPALCSCGGGVNAAPGPGDAPPSADAAAADVSYEDYYRVEVPEDWILSPLPGRKNAFSLYPDERHPRLGGRCAVRFVSDIYAIAATRVAADRILNAAVVSAKSFLLGSLPDAEGLEQSGIENTAVNNLTGFSYTLSSPRPGPFYRGLYYVLLNPDDIGVSYVQAASTDEESAEECLAQARRIIGTLSYTAPEDIY